MRVDYRIKRIPYAWNSGGYCTELIVVDIPATQDISGLRKVVRDLEHMMEEESYSDTVCSPHDCSGQSFGSRWTRVDWSDSEDGYVVCMKHSWAVDI